MDLKSLMVDTKSAFVEYPGLNGFVVEVANLARDRLIALRKECMYQKMDRKTKQLIDQLDDQKFIQKFTEATVKGWKGLTLGKLEQLMLVDIGSQNPETELEYTPENAVTLVSNSAEFDGWLNETVFDLENFRSKRDAGTVGKTGEVAE